jgi:hypothetical protein
MIEIAGQRPQNSEAVAVELGVSAAEPGYTCVRIAPVPEIEASRSGVVRSPMGDISVAWFDTRSKFVLKVDIPVGVHLQVRLPAAPSDGLFVDGEPIDVDTQTVRTDHWVELAVLPGNKYEFEVCKSS